MSATTVMIRAWFDAVIKPTAAAWARQGIPLTQFGEVLLGYGVGVLRSGGVADDAIRTVFEKAISDVKTDKH